MIDQQLRIQITSMVCSAQRNKGGGRRPGDIRGAEYAVGVIAPELKSLDRQQTS
ncbi:hypothetical protein [Variovorax sp. dw_308]|uniref:hypothetical protein n=1 Tax=Variovorax sp. dw_308 TaxID=2721546 RepID=UPI001C47EB4B|nr:hypothetical protein [Variovorax sp. dw_308]